MTSVPLCEGLPSWLLVLETLHRLFLVLLSACKYGGQACRQAGSGLKKESMQALYILYTIVLTAIMLAEGRIPALGPDTTGKLAAKRSLEAKEAISS